MEKCTLVHFCDAIKFDVVNLGFPTRAGVGQEVGLVIWRVEKLKVYKKDHDEDCYDGVFFEGDSYIILQTKMRNNAFERHIFFWLGGMSVSQTCGYDLSGTCTALPRILNNTKRNKI